MAFDPDNNGGSTPAPDPKSAIPASAGPTSDMPTGDTLTPPAAPASQPQLQLQPAPQPEIKSRHFFRAVARSLGGAVLGTLAGPDPVDYKTNESGEQVATPRKQSNLDRVRRIAEAALTGMAAGAEAPRRPGANMLAGVSAGFTAEQQKLQQQDALARQQDKANFEQEQKLITDKAIRAGHNAATFALHQKSQQEANDHDPERQIGLAIQAGAEDFIKRNPGTTMTAKVVSADQAHSMVAADPHTIGDYAFYPLGMRDVKDADGNLVYEQDGITPKQEGQILAIGGGREAGIKAGKIPVPQEVITQAKKFEGLVPGLNLRGVEAGTEMPMDRFFALTKTLAEAEGRKMDGWKEAKAGDNAVTVKGPDGKPTKMQRNTFDNTMRPYPGTPIETEKTQSEIDKNRAEAKKAGADAADKSQKPIYAFNTKTKQLEQTTRADMSAQPGLYTNPVDVKESDIRKDVDLVRQLGDAQLNLSRYRAAAGKMDDPSYIGLGAVGGSKRAMAALIGDDRFKAEFMGAQIPTDWLNKLVTSENWSQLSKPQQEAVIGYIGARGAVIAYQKAVSGSGRSNKEQLDLELQNIPSPLLPPDVREKQFDRFQQNIDQTGAGLPKMVGIDRPQEIRQKIETEEAKKEGATHVYDPNSGNIIPADATPVKNIFQKVIGYTDKNGRFVRFPKQ